MRPRDIDVGEGALVEQEGMKGASDAVEANDVAPRVDTTWQGGRGPRDINRGEVKHLGTHGHGSRQHNHEREQATIPIVRMAGFSFEGR